MEALVRRGADINARGEEGYTPLHEAVELDHWLAALRLLEMGADPSSRMTRDTRRLHCLS